MTTLRLGMNASSSVVNPTSLENGSHFHLSGIPDTHVSRDDRLIEVAIIFECHITQHQKADAAADIHAPPGDP